MTKQYKWSEDKNNNFSFMDRVLSDLSYYVRDKHYDEFLKLIKPKSSDEVLDVGTTPGNLQIQKDANFFEKKYPYKQKLTICSIEDCSMLKKEFALKKFVFIKPSASLPFSDKQFDIVTSWAVLEHVGNKKEQQFFLKELNRIGKKVFLTTPDKYAIFEPHTQLFFLHWLPDRLFRVLLSKIGKNFWALERNLRILTKSELRDMVPDNKFKIKTFKLLDILPSHLLIYKN